MITITVKTLTGSDFPFEVSGDLTVDQFKEHISQTVNVPVERQRLIFQGRVLQDGRRLSEIGLDHRTIHLVERLPGMPTGGSGTSSPSPQLRTDAGDSGAQHRHGPSGEILQQQMVVGSVGLPSGDLSRDEIIACLRRILNRLGEIGRRAQLEARDLADGTIQVDIRLRTPPSDEESMGNDGRRRIDGPATQRYEHIRHVIRHINHILYHLENDDVDRSNNGEQSAGDGDSSISPEACDNSAHEAIGATEPAATAHPVGAGEQASTECDYVIEIDTIDGEEVEIRQIRIGGMASLLEEILRLEDHLRPHLARYQVLLRRDENYSENQLEGRRAARLFNCVQTILHNLAHVYHAYSDLNVHFCQPPPRFTYPQLIGARSAPRITGEGSRRGMTMSTTMQASAEVQITMNFQRNNDQENPSPPAQPRQPTMTGAQFPSVRVEGNNSGAYTSVDITPNTVTINQVTARIEPGGGEGGRNEGNSTAAGVQPAAAAMPPNFVQQLMQGLMGASTGVLSGNIGIGPGGIRGRVEGFFRPQGGQAPRGDGSGNRGPRMGIPMPMQNVAGRPPTPRQGQYMFGGPAPGARIPPPQSVFFTAAPYNPAASGQNAAVFIGHDPPTTVPLYTFDQYLPCGSRHFDPRQRPSILSHRPHSHQARPTSDQSADANQESAGSPAQDVSEHELEFERHLEPVVRSVVSGLQESIGRPSGDGGHELLQFIPIFTAPRGAGGRGPRTGPRGTLHPRPDGRMPRPSSDPNLVRGNDTAQSEGTGSSAPSERALLEHIVRGVYSSMTGNSTETIGDHMRALGQRIESGGDSVFMDMLQAVLVSLTFSDIWALFANNSTPLDRMRPVLRRHFVETLLNGNESPSEEDIRSAVTRAVATDAEMWREVTAEVSAADGLDFAATMIRCEEAFLVDVLFLVFGYSFAPGEDFGRRLYDRTWLYAREMVTAAVICCADGERGFDEIAVRISESAMRTVGPEFREMMSGAGVQHLRTLYTRHQLERSEVEQYLVKKSESENQASPPTQVTTILSDGKTEENDKKKPEDNSSSVTDTDEKSEYATASGISESNDSQNSDWRNHLPPEWARVVETDVERQRTMSPQKPLSDAYLNGMPSKRRKLVLEQRPREVLNAAATSTDAFLKEVLRQAIADAGVAPITGEQTEDVIERISVDQNGPELATAFAENVERRFGARLRREEENGSGDTKDFDPKRFPKASERFLKK